MKDMSLPSLELVVVAVVREIAMARGADDCSGSGNLKEMSGSCCKANGK